MNINTMKKQAIFLIVTVICFAIAIPVLAEVSNGDEDTTFVPTVSSVPVPNLIGDVLNGPDDVGSLPVVSNTNPGNAPGSVSNGNDDNMTVNTGNGGGNTTPTTPVSSSGSSSGSGSSGGGSGRSSPVVSENVSTPSCEFITGFMRLDQENDSSQVAKLQLFLKNSQELDVDVTGVFDEKTDAAVRNFQAKYLSDTMGPWGATRPSGYVYITTIKKINQLACNQSLSLSSDELAIIDAYKGRLTNGDIEVGSDLDNGTSTPNVLEVGTNEDNSNVATVAKASILSRFWNFILNLFR